METAITILRQDPKDKREHVETVHKVFRTDEKLKPETISALLGVDVDIDPNEIKMRRRLARGQLTSGLVLHILLVSLVLSSIFIFGTMWLMKIGIFHDTVATF